MADWHVSVDVDGLSRQCDGHTPDAAPAQPLPLVVALHGRFGTAASMRRLSSLDSLAEREHFIVAYPEGIERSGNDGRGATPAAGTGVDGVGFIRCLIEGQTATSRVDRDRVFALGMSNGGIMCHRLAIELSGQIAGIGTVAGLLPERLAAAERPQYAVSVVLVHGTDDRRVPFAGGPVRSRGEGGSVLSAADTAAWWRAVDGCTSDVSRQEFTTPAGDPTSVSVIASDGGRGGSAVETWVVAGGGHTWPGAPFGLLPRFLGRTNARFSAAEVIWRHLAAHAKPSERRHR